jgi:phage/plasmid-like protein (TIGR03299 family)
MAHNLDTTNGKYAFAFRGDRNAIWHRHGQQHQEGWTIADWQREAGLNYHVEQQPVFVRAPDGTMKQTRYLANVRSDTGAVFGVHTERFKNHQALDMLEFLNQYIEADGRFVLDAAGALGQGERCWATATYADDMTVGGDRHVARLLATTAFDGSLATTLMATFLRTVCGNTLGANLGNKQNPVIKYRHSSVFDREKAGRELAEVVKGFGAFKALGDAMAAQHISEKEVVLCFKHCLDIPLDTTSKDDVSPRKFGQYTDLWHAYKTTCNETDAGTKWATLNAVSRYTDHMRSVRGSDGTERGVAQARFESSVFGTGQALKQKCIEYLTDDELLRQVSAATSAELDDKSLLAAVSSLSGPINRLG